MEGFYEGIKCFDQNIFCPLFPFVSGESFGQGVAFPGQPFRTSAWALFVKYLLIQKFLFKLFSEIIAMD